MSGLVWFAPASVVYMCLYTHRVWTTSGKLCCTDGGVRRDYLLYLLFGDVWLLFAHLNCAFWLTMITDPSFWFYIKHGVVWQDKHCSGLGVGVLWIVTFCPEDPMGWCLAAEEVKGKGCGYRKCLSEVLYPFCPGYTCNFFSSCAVLRSSRSGSSLGGAAGGCCLQMQHNESVVVHHNTLQVGTS